MQGGLKELTWKAFYKDGQVLEKLNSDGSKNSYEDIDRNRLSHFVLYDGERAVFAVYLREGQRLIYRQRNWVKNGEKIGLIYLVGWHMNIGGKNIKSIAYVCPDGYVELDDDRDDLRLVREEFDSQEEFVNQETRVSIKEQTEKLLNTDEAREIFGVPSGKRIIKFIDNKIHYLTGEIDVNNGFIVKVIEVSEEQNKEFAKFFESDISSKI